MAVRGCFGVWVRGCSGAGGYRLCFLFLRCCFCFFEEENGEFVLVRAGRRDSVEVEESGWMDWSVFNWLPFFIKSYILPPFSYTEKRAD
jgi:hypothetical protein